MGIVQLGKRHNSGVGLQFLQLSRQQMRCFPCGVLLTAMLHGLLHMPGCSR